MPLNCKIFECVSKGFTSEQCNRLHTGDKSTELGETKEGKIGKEN